MRSGAAYMTHYWPIENDLKDYKGTNNLWPGVIGGVTLAPDRLGNTNSSVLINNAFLAMPTDVYFNSSFTVMAWVKPFSTIGQGRLLDCGFGQTDNVIVMISSGNSNRPAAQIFRGSNSRPVVESSTAIDLNEWGHLAVTFEDKTMTIYVNGSVTANQTYADVWTPLGVSRPMCYLGKSNWADAYVKAYFDEIKIFNAALSIDQVQAEMNGF